MIETRLLHYFLAVANAQSFTKAAEMLGLSQSTLSKQLGDLERQLGKQLFARSKKAVALTEEGLYLRGRAIQVLELMEQTELILRAEENFIEGDIRLGCGEISLPDCALDAFRQVRLSHSRCRLHVHTESVEAITDLLSTGLLDMALIFEPATHTQFDCIPLSVKDDWGLLMPEDSPLTQVDHVTFDDLRRLPLIYPQRIYHNHRHPSGFTIDNSELNIIATYNQKKSAIQMAAQNLGYAYCLKNATLAEGTDGLVFRPLEPRFPATLYVLVQKDTPLSPAARVYLDQLLRLG